MLRRLFRALFPSVESGDAVVLFLLGAICFAFALFGACLARSSGQDLGGLDLPVEKPAPVASKTTASGPLTRWREPTPRLVPPPPEQPPTQPDEKPPTFYGTEIKSENRTIFYVIDISGSMAYDVAPYTRPDGSTANGTRLDRAKAELEKSIAALAPDWSYDVLAYDCSSTRAFGSLRRADEEARRKGMAWVAALEPGGGTGTGYAVALALHDAPETRLVALLTDGCPNCFLGGLCGSDEDFARHLQVIKQANHGAAIDVFGVGATGPFKKFCEDIASQNGGTYSDCR